MSQSVPTAASGISASDYNPLLPEVRQDPYPYYAAMRREGGVHRLIPGLPFFAVSRYADVTRVVHHPEDFSSTALQLLVEGGGINIGPNAGALRGHRILGAPMMISVDPPDHGRLRQIVNRGFTPRRIAALEPRLREIAEECIDRVRESGRMDLVRDLSIPFPVTVIAEMLGVEAEKRDQFKEWSDTLVVGLSGAGTTVTPEDLRSSADEMAEYLDRIVAERRRAPRDDLISVLCEATGEETLGSGELLSFIVLLLIAGNETTTNLIGNAAHALLRHPEQLAQVVDDPALIPQTIEEALRWDSPIQGLPRKVVREVEIGGTKLPKDAFLMVLFASANRDEDEFEEADRFDIHRKPQGHVAFGHGIHFCLGAALARLEARVAFETLFARCRNLELEIDSVPVVESNLLRGPATLPLRFEPS